MTDDTWERPKWVVELRDFLQHHIIDFIAKDGSDDEVTDKVTEAAMAVVCAHYGHWVENDHCGKPDHRYCIWCFRGFPEITPGRYNEPTT